MDIVTAFKKIKEDKSLCAIIDGTVYPICFFEGVPRSILMHNGEALRGPVDLISVEYIMADSWEVFPIANLTS